MRKASVARWSFVFFVLLVVVPPAHAAPPQADCTAVNPPSGQQKFTGQISAAPNGSEMEVTSGDQMVLVRFNSSVAVCQGGRSASLNALTRGASVVVYGSLKRVGRTSEMDADRILVAGSPQSDRPPAQTVHLAGSDVPRGTSKAAVDDWNSGGSAPQPSGSGVSQGIDSTGGSRGQTGSTISCSALLFNVNSGRDAATGRASGRSSASGITCKRSVDQLALQFAQDAMNGRRLQNVRLSWQNQLEVVLNDAEISSVQFTSDNGSQVVEITFSYQKAEVVYVPSGTKVLF
jgi:type VI protein secretion system component Hcp